MTTNTGPTAEAGTLAGHSATLPHHESAGTIAAVGAPTCRSGRGGGHLREAEWPRGVRSAGASEERDRRQSVQRRLGGVPGRRADGERRVVDGRTRECRWQPRNRQAVSGCQPSVVSASRGPLSTPRRGIESIPRFGPSAVVFRRAPDGLSATRTPSRTLLSPGALNRPVRSRHRRFACEARREGR